jgi:hypothetical protein
MIAFILIHHLAQNPTLAVAATNPFDFLLLRLTSIVGVNHEYFSFFLPHDLTWERRDFAVFYQRKNRGASIVAYSRPTSIMVKITRKTRLT